MKKKVSELPSPVNRAEEVEFQILIRLEEIVVELRKLNKPEPKTTRKKAVKKDDTGTVNAKNAT